MNKPHKARWMQAIHELHDSIHERSHQGPFDHAGPGHLRGPGHGPGHHGNSRRRGRRRGRGVGRGEVRIAVLALLGEHPMHGYQIMQELSDRSQGAWQPSPGSIYPLLAQMADEGLVSSSSEGGRNVFSLTDAGREAVDQHGDETPVWERMAQDAGDVNFRELIGGLAVAAKQVSMVGDADQVARASEILADARKRVYQILAE